MTATQKILLLSGVGVLYSFLAKAQSANNLNFYPQSVTGIDINGGSPVLTAAVKVQNVSNQQITLRSLAGNVYANNFLIGNAGNFAGLIVPPNSEVLLYVKFNLSWLGVVQDIINAFQGNGWKQVVEWNGQVNIQGLPIQQVKMNFSVG